MNKILLVDDHSDIRRLIKLSLGKTFEIFEAEDGATALEIATLHKPDVVVLDVMMAGELDGLQVLDAIKGNPALKHIRVIMVTARGQVTDHDDGMKRGADAYFIKPFSPMELVIAIKKLIAGSTLH